MKKKAAKKENGLTRSKASSLEVANYNDILNNVVELLESARRTSARATNAIMTATYWEIGRRVVEYEQGGSDRAVYGKLVVKQLASDLEKRFGRGFSARNVWYMREFYLGWQIVQTPSALFANSPKSQTLSGFLRGIETQPIVQTVSALSKEVGIAQTVFAQSKKTQIFQTASGKFDLGQIAARFSLPWSHYVLLLKVDNPDARRFYETEALRGGWCFVRSTIEPSPITPSIA